MEYIVETHNLTKRFGKEIAVNDLNLKIPKGEVYGFLGPNGAGKSTTLRMLLGLMRPTAGSVRIFGKDLKKERISILRNVGALVENPSYYSHLTAFENLEAVRKILGAPKEKIDEVLELVRLSKAADKKVNGFSLGMKQRLGIAMALLNEPKLLILDEPTNGLDPAGIIEMRNLIKRLPKEKDMTVLLSSHLLAEIDQVATYVGVISKGKLIFQDSIKAMRQKARRKIRLKVSDANNAYHALLAKGIKTDFRDNVIYLDEQSDEAVAKVVEILVAEGYSVYRVEEEQPSLEDIFLKMTAGGDGR
ncbi:ABC transporter ATP-binding protein [Parageobacillus thermoglucosidasius]|uniref:ABC transporter ATP-binding protein n=1 Tax=Parageobacillus thermoglucosidasius TaxID=1426 RepID=UPI000E120939|nr:ABC transporter ATP-binding protein [Parageobacillus thermoglucosidasius]MED4904008.1 ABC transporter ATP-binding protein [Parageobacillus thermoglucosidasius]MED4914963.1 ABC transporter ATP-binding protein [Parageobacillus thermoglucosidasius]MED4943783.1 ABC transporter ATP-binding protein [Parageobacillus thermoglucosidasius]MED4984209.1 ABC transporter ATP-binding protein [Parageobacillus thermoglucosidasius]RDE18672.1 ABC transporter ATP-binding protein [Parageobacillus thermoglucosid